ncbi:MAG: hypothetical protein K6T65_08335 [Peptococcaceae bacterium]|nr:hypothetical protein [Peptococcaceae bacterium]
MIKQLGLEIAQKRKKMRLSQRKAASMIEKMYGVKLSHSYFSLIERGRVDSIGGDLKDALKDFFKISPEKTAPVPEAGEEKPPAGDAGEFDIPLHRIPLYKNSRVIKYLDIAGPILADFALVVTSDMPEWGVFCGDLLICRKAELVEGDLAVTQKGEIFAYKCDKNQDLPAAEGKVILITKRSVTLNHFEAAINAAASKLSVELLVRELARRTGLREIDLVRSLAVLKSFVKDLRNRS